MGAPVRAACRGGGFRHLFARGPGVRGQRRHGGWGGCRRLLPRREAVNAASTKQIHPGLVDASLADGCLPERFASAGLVKIARRGIKNSRSPGESQCRGIENEFAQNNKLRDNCVQFYSSRQYRCPVLDFSIADLDILQLVRPSSPVAGPGNGRSHFCDADCARRK